jgi:D-alanyl-lipoteichoic acid acyltransferase DltB (MBOAT superfamily)
MSFTGFPFWAFFALLFVVYWLTRGQRAQNLILLLASYIFYGWLAPWYALLLGISTLADFYLAARMKSDRGHRRAYLTLSLILNIGVLAFFKYYNFFHTQVADALTSVGLPVGWLFINVFLPAGLSFYTLKKLAYMIDVYRGSLEPSNDLVSFGLFVAFFPQIVAGPIDRYQKLMPQIQQRRRWHADLFTSAWPLLVTGFFKKIVVADTLRSVVDRIFALNDPSLALVLAGALGFTLQILADFSAYTDLARGVALLLGFQTSENFNKPYLSLTPTEFWNRWHITLSTWLRDYIFFPVRRVLLKRARGLPNWLNLAMPPLVTMFISGLWHGAGLTFLLWGIYYGVLIAGYQFIGLPGDWRPADHLKRFFAWLLMFAFIVFGWLIFRAPSLTWLLHVFTRPTWTRGSSDWIVALTVLSMIAAYALPIYIKHLLDEHVPRGFAHAFYYAALTLGSLVFTSSVTSDFIYFQF